MSRTRLVSLVSLALVLHPVTNPSAQSLPSYDQVAGRPRTVVDYFLLCPEFNLDDDGALEFFPGIASERESFDQRKRLLAEGYSAQDFSVDVVTIDIPNAYIQLRGQQNGLGFALSFVYFDRPGKSNIPAFSYYSEGGDGETFWLYLYEVDAPGHWIDVTAKLLPDVSLADLDVGSRDRQGAYPEVDWEFLLPRKGTTVLAIPHMTYEMAETASPSEDFELVKRLKSRELELLWNRKEGRFLKGAVR